MRCAPCGGGAASSAGAPLGAHGVDSTQIANCHGTASIAQPGSLAHQAERRILPILRGAEQPAAARRDDRDLDVRGVVALGRGDQADAHVVEEAGLEPLALLAHLRDEVLPSGPFVAVDHVLGIALHHPGGRRRVERRGAAREDDGERDHHERDDGDEHDEQGPVAAPAVGFHVVIMDGAGDPGQGRALDALAAAVLHEPPLPRAGAPA